MVWAGEQVSKILVMGASGLLGHTLTRFLASCGYEVTTLSRSNVSDIAVDASNRSRLFDALKGKEFDVIVNLIALTSVESCEDHPDLALRANTLPVENIASWIELHSPNSHLIQISTDQVYDGLGPHGESDIKVVNTYGLTKYAGELAALQIASTVLRTNFVGKSDVEGRESLTDWLVNALKNEQHVQVLSDVKFSPVSMETLCTVIEQVVVMKPIGVFNVGSSNGMTKADFNFAFAEALGLPTKFMSLIESSDAKFLRARRPKDMTMDSSKIETHLGISIPSLKNEIERMVSSYAGK